MMKTPQRPAVLVVDDEPAIRRLLARVLPGQGYEVTAAESGEAALEQARRRAFDLAVCDITMPGMDGVATLKALKGLRPQMEVVMSTGHASLESAIASLKSGAYDYVAKPYAMEQLFGVLEKALEHRRLKAKVDELEAADRLKTEFLANMSHELRTPLTSIVGYTSLILDGVFGAPTPKQAAALDRVLANSKSLLSLINAILDISTLNAGMMSVSLEDFDAAALVCEVAQTLQGPAAQKGLRLDTDAPQPVPMRSDKTKVKQILINLAANAVKFTGKGGVTLAAALTGDGEVRLSVRDTGPGIAPEHLGTVFEKFTQVDGSATRAHGGTGLGLSITHKLCELLGGSVSVESRPGQGSLFAARLPAAMTTARRCPEDGGDGFKEDLSGAGPVRGAIIQEGRPWTRTRPYRA